MRLKLTLLVLIAGIQYLSASEYFTVICRDVYFTSPTIGWIIGGHGLYRTQDGGQTWASLNDSYLGLLQHPASPRLYSGLFLDDEVGWIMPGYITGNQLLRTQDGGQSWEDLSPVFPEAHDGGYGIRFLRFTGRLTGWLVVDKFILTGTSIDSLAGAEPAFLLRTEDGGRTWERRELEWHVVDIQFTDQAYGWILARETEGTLDR